MSHPRTQPAIAYLADKLFFNALEVPAIINEEGSGVDAVTEGFKFFFVAGVPESPVHGVGFVLFSTDEDRVLAF